MSSRTHIRLLPVLAAGLASSAASAQQFTFISGAALPNSGGEIVSFYSPTSDVLSTYSSGSAHGVRVNSLGSDGALSFLRDVDLSATFASGVFSLSSVQADSLGRDFGVATLIPGGETAGVPNRASTPGQAVFFQISTGTILGSVPVGFHPDSVTITPDGNRVVVANEGEFINSTVQTPGSVSVINLTGIGSAAALGTALGSASVPVVTATFAPANLAPGVSIDSLRNNRTALPTGADDIEPEYVTADNTRAFVSLQENNALATFDFATGQFTSVQGLGTITQRIDNTDRDGASGLPGGASNPRPLIAIDDVATGLPMPDTIATFSVGGVTYAVTANEGDARPDDGDQARIAGGRLNVIRPEFNGGTSNQMFGTRSVSIFNLNSGARVWDSSDGQDVVGATFLSFEDFIAANDRETFGMNQNNAFDFQPTPFSNYTTGIFTNGGTGSGLESNSDTRSDDKGPEPESVAVGSYNGRTYMFTAMERQGGIFMFDITDLSNIFFVDYINLLVNGASGGQAYLSPESLEFVGAGESEFGFPVLLVGYENTSQAFGGVAVLAIPEPRTYAALAGLLGLGLALWRRRRS